MNIYLRERESSFTNLAQIRNALKRFFSHSNPNVMQKLLRYLFICAINHVDVVYCLRMDDDQYNTMLILLIILLVWMKTNLAQANSYTNNIPFVAIKMKSKRKETIKEENKLHTQKQKLKNNDLDWNRDEEVCRPLMTFTRVFTQLMRREKQCTGFELHSTGKNSMKTMKEATRSN